MLIEFGLLRSERLGFTLETVLKALQTNGIQLTEILAFENVKLISKYDISATRETDHVIKMQSVQK